LRTPRAWRKGNDQCDRRCLRRGDQLTMSTAQVRPNRTLPWQENRPKLRHARKQHRKKRRRLKVALL
jgi:hypothetical protein